MIDKQASQETISRLRRATSHPLTVDVCDIARALLTERDALLARVSQLEESVKQFNESSVKQSEFNATDDVKHPVSNAKPNRKAYMKDYMRDYMRKNPEKRAKRPKAG